MKAIVKIVLVMLPAATYVIGFFVGRQSVIEADKRAHDIWSDIYGDCEYVIATPNLIIDNSLDNTQIEE